MSKHTLGPWNSVPSGPIMRENYSQPFAISEQMRPNLIAGCFGDVSGGEIVARANARLIAACPEMYEALKEAIADIELSAIDPSDFPWIQKAKNIIAKAEGRT